MLINEEHIVAVSEAIDVILEKPLTADRKKQLLQNGYSKEQILHLAEIYRLGKEIQEHIRQAGYTE